MLHPWCRGQKHLQKILFWKLVPVRRWLHCTRILANWGGISFSRIAQEGCFVPPMEGDPVGGKEVRMAATTPGKNKGQSCHHVAVPHNLTFWTQLPAEPPGLASLQWQRCLGKCSSAHGSQPRIIEAGLLIFDSAGEARGKSHFCSWFSGIGLNKVVRWISLRKVATQHSCLQSEQRTMVTWWLTVGSHFQGPRFAIFSALMRLFLLWRGQPKCPRAFPTLKEARGLFPPPKKTKIINRIGNGGLN